MDKNTKENSPAQPTPEPVSYARSNNFLPNFFDKFFSFFTKKTVAGLAILVLVIGIGATIIAVQRSTEIRQRAATSTYSLSGGQGDLGGNDKQHKILYAWQPPTGGQYHILLVRKNYDPEWNKFDYRVGEIEGLSFITFTDGQPSILYKAAIFNGLTGEKLSNVVPVTTAATSTQGTADLIIQSLTLSTYNPTPGQTVTATVIIKNQGSQAVNSLFATALWADRGSAPPCNDKTYNQRKSTYNSLAAGATQTLDMPFFASSTNGLKTVWVFVDDSCIISESNEGNNTASVNYTVGATATVSVYVFVDKDGDGTKDGSTDPYYLNATATLTGGGLNITRSMPNGSYAFKVPSGTYTITVPTPAGYRATTPNPISKTVPPDTPDVYVGFGIQSAPTSTLTPPSGGTCDAECASRGASDGYCSASGSSCPAGYSYIGRIGCTRTGLPACCCKLPTPTPTRTPTRTPTPTPRPTSIPTPTPTGVVTPTPSGTGTQFALSIGLDGIGSVGDNATPNDSSGSNKNPVRTTRNAMVQIYNATNNLVASTSGTIAYNSTQGIFIGNVSLGTNTDIQSGSFIVKVKSDGYLKRRIPGIQTIVLGQVNTMPQINLVTGDVNGDNAINILDYNILISCSIFSTDNHATCNQNAAYATLSDLDDNGAINQFDYNLFLRELSVQNGD